MAAYDISASASASSSAANTAANRTAQNTQLNSSTGAVNFGSINRGNSGSDTTTWLIAAGIALVLAGFAWFIMKGKR